jgi:hypothetical protein
LKSAERPETTPFRHLAFSPETGRWPAQVGKLTLKSGNISCFYDLIFPQSTSKPIDFE